MEKQETETAPLREGMGKRQYPASQQRKGWDDSPAESLSEARVNRQLRVVLIAFWLAWFRQGRKKPWKKGRKSAGKKGLEGACLTKEQQTDNAWFPSGAWGGMTAPQYPFPGWGKPPAARGADGGRDAPKKEELF